MKKLFCALLLLGGVIHNAGALAATVPATLSAPATKRPVRKTARKPVVRKLPPPVDPTNGDNVDGDDLTVRRAAADSLGTIPGSVVVVDPSNGRILTMVNQKLGLASGFIPCSTIKLITALAALTENIVSRNTNIYTSRYVSYNLTQALARSNNQYFNILGTRLGFERVHHYAEMLGLGETAGLDVAGEQPGLLAAEPPKFGGVGMMTSFGTGISMTPMELAALLSAIANGGTLYYLQYPHTPEEIDQFTPKVKHPLQLAANGIDDIKMGMRGAVDFGTARRAGYDPAEPILGKTGTCTDFQSANKMGWFGSFNEVGAHQLVVVVMLTGSRGYVSGPIASGVAGGIYKRLSAQRYFTADNIPPQKKSDLPEMISTSPCCNAVARR
ncbi:MAG TPA: penicillin-binding transpeptidase domain-containing protein [Candidatus Acidoferrales bacterium]|nr:penicillin-binding transpeptidase domain-containing protein [Candidatus Acidoferrales bacterium]